MPDTTTTNGWNEYAKHVLKELERHSAWQDRMDEKFAAHQRDMALQHASLQTEIAMLKVKAGVWGAVAGAIPAAVVAFYALAK